MKSIIKKSLILAATLVGAVVAARLTVFAHLSVKTVKAERRDLTAKVYGNGTVEAKVVVGISSKIIGKIVELSVDQGDRVKQGDLLAKLENDDLAEQVRQAEANVLKTRATEKVDEATLRKALASADMAKRNAKRYEQLLTNDFVAHKDTEEFQVAAQVALEEVRRAEAAVEADKRDESQWRATLGFAKAKLADANIYAPGDGLIISRDLEMGAVVTPGQSIFQFTDPRMVWVKANVDESQMPGVRAGSPAVITLRSVPGEQFSGRVARIAHQSDRVTEESEVDVAFDPPLEHFRLGEQADVYIVTGAQNGVLSLPAAAVVSKGNARGVWVLEDDRLHFKEVATGIKDPREFVEIRSGLAEGEQAVMAPPPVMREFADGKRAGVSR